MRTFVRYSTLLGIVALSLGGMGCGSDDAVPMLAPDGGNPSNPLLDGSVAGDSREPDVSRSADADLDTGRIDRSASDANAPTSDASNPTADAISPTPDAGNPRDASNPTPDATIPTPDSGNPTSDASNPTADAISPTPDAPSDVNLTGVDRFRHICMTQGMPITHVRDLTTAVGPRSAGSPGDAMAVAWALERMRAIGLQNVRSDPVTVPHWQRGEEHAELLGATETKLTIAALGGSVATPAGGVEGEVIQVASVSALNALSNAQVQGKIVFINTVTQRTQNASGYSAAVGSRRSGPSAAASKGAIATIVRSISTSMSNFPHTGDMNSASIPAAAISVADALVLASAVAAGPTRVRLTLGCQTLPNAQSANVIGEVVGRDTPDDIVVLGAHLDSWDLATGALDDGAGVAMALETGKLLATQAPEGMMRTIRIVLFANEEAGLSGANAYASAHQAELARHVIALEADLGGDRVYGATFQAGASATTILRDLLAPLAPLGIAAATAGGGNGADLGPISRAGVPVAELLQDLNRYFDYHHSSDDIIDRVDAAALTQATCAMGVFAYQIGRSTADLGRASGAALTASDDEH